MFRGSLYVDGWCKLEITLTENCGCNNAKTKCALGERTVEVKVVAIYILSYSMIGGRAD